MLCMVCVCVCMLREFLSWRIRIAQFLPVAHNILLLAISKCKYVREAYIRELHLREGPISTLPFILIYVFRKKCHFSLPISPNIGIFVHSAMVSSKFPRWRNGSGYFPDRFFCIFKHLEMVRKMRKITNAQHSSCRGGRVPHPVNKLIWFTLVDPLWASWVVRNWWHSPALVLKWDPQTATITSSNTWFKSLVT